MVMTVRIHEYGGPEVLRYEDVPIGSPGPGEVLVRHRAIGLNFADIHTREGRYPVDSLPHAIGGEACGVIDEVGEGVDYVKIGDRVAYSTGGHALPRGTYTEARVLSADRLIVLPDEIGDETAAAMVTKGLTAQYLLKDVYPVKRGDTVLIHAAAGGVGLILSQWAHHLGARVIGVVSTEEKAALASQHGCHHTIISNKEDIVARVRELTDGEGVPVVYDAVGKDTFDASLHAPFAAPPRHVGVLRDRVRPGATAGHFRTQQAGVPLCDQRRLLLAHANPRGTPATRRRSDRCGAKRGG
jgi:NADPH2:quinone reductase